MKRRFSFKKKVNGGQRSRKTVPLGQIPSDFCDRINSNGSCTVVLYHTFASGPLAPGVEECVVVPIDDLVRPLPPSGAVGQPALLQGGRQAGARPPGDNMYK